MMMDRRIFLSSLGLLGACGPKLAVAFDGFAYIASQSARTVSIVSLSKFRLSKQLALDAEPSAVLVKGSSVYVLTPSNGSIVVIDGITATIIRKFRVAATCETMRLAPDGKSIWVLGREPQALIQFDLLASRINRTIRLIKPVRDFDLSPIAPIAVIGSPASLVNLESGRVERLLEIDGEAAPIVFRPDGKEILAADGPARRISIADVATGRLLVKLPLPLEPERFCFTRDNGGQMFVTGRGADAVVIVSPYQTAVGETILAGRAPGNMAVDVNNLYIANPETGDLTVIAIADRSLLAKIPVGQEPVQVILTPDGQYCLVINKKSSDLSVIRVSKLGDYQRSKAAPMFTVVPLGAGPVHGAICSL